MKEVKTPKKPLAIYYTIVLLLLLLLNVVLVPWMNERQIKEVDYGTFMSMTEEKNIGKVDIESNQIIFTDKDNTQVYKTGLMDDSGLTERLYTAGAEFSSEIVEQGSPILSFLICFLGCYIVATFVIHLICYVFELPVLRHLDALMGGVFGLARGVLLLFILFALVPIIQAVVPVQQLTDILNASRLAPLFDSKLILSILGA